MDSGFKSADSGEPSAPLQTDTQPLDESALQSKATASELPSSMLSPANAERERFYALPKYARELLHLLEGPKNTLRGKLSGGHDPAKAMQRFNRTMDWAVFGLGLMLSVILVGGQLAMSQVSSNPLWPTMAFLPILPVALGLLYYFSERRRISRLFSSELDRSGIVERLAEGPEFANEIIAALPAPIAWLHRQSSNGKSDLQSAVGLLTSNLDWFLEPRPRLWRWEWLGTTLSISAAVAIIALSLVIPGAFTSPLAGPLNTFATALAFSSNFYNIASSIRARLASRALAASLRARFEA